MFDYLCTRAFFPPDLSMKISNLSNTFHTIFIKFSTVFLRPKVLPRAKWHRNRMTEI